MVMILHHSVTIFAMSCVCKDSLKCKNYGHDFASQCDYFCYELCL